MSLEECTPVLDFEVNGVDTNGMVLDYNLVKSWLWQLGVFHCKWSYSRPQDPGSAVGGHCVSLAPEVVLRNNSKVSCFPRKVVNNQNGVQKLRSWLLFPTEVGWIIPRFVTSLYISRTS